MQLTAIANEHSTEANSNTDDGSVSMTPSSILYIYSMTLLAASIQVITVFECSIFHFGDMDGDDIVSTSIAAAACSDICVTGT